MTSVKFAADPALIRAMAILLPIVVTWLLWLWLLPDHRTATAALLACAWNMPTLLVVHLLAGYFGWWHFVAQGGLFWAMPVDLWLGWVLLWGAIPALLLPRLHLGWIAALLIGLDLLTMPLLHPVLQLHATWLIGEAVAVLIVLLPALFLAHWTAKDSALARRTILLVIAFSGLMFWVLPAATLAFVGGNWQPLFARPLWLTSLGVQLLSIPAIVGLSAMQEFVQRGGGTPLPFDPPKQLVTSGVYSYLANPMQATISILLLGWGVMLVSTWVAISGAVALLFSIGLAAWSEEADLQKRFDGDWQHYRQNVQNWLPRWRPYLPLDAMGHQSVVARLYVASGCFPCSQLGAWLLDRQPLGLQLLSAEQHPTHTLTRLTYEPTDNTPSEQGLAALARALEHIHLGWAMLGWALRLPFVCPLLQILVDAVGGEPRMAFREHSL
jgi:protein-S-isoprenylcysteine O-methyltransferase Ste14